MSLIVLLDAGPLGMITNPKSSPENEACKNLLAALAYSGVEIVVPEIADYEVRRELLRGGETVIGTTNVRHLALFASACIWHEITPV